MELKYQIDRELKEIYMSRELKHRIIYEADRKTTYDEKIYDKTYNGTVYNRKYSRGKSKYSRIAAACIAVLLLGGTTVFGGYYLYNKISVNEEILPQLDQMYCISADKLQMDADEYGMINETFEDYEAIQNELGLELLNSALAGSNPYMQGEIKTDNKDFAIISIENYIVQEEVSVALTADIMLSETQMEHGWDTDYLGFYQFKEQYTSSQGYKVNLIEDTAGEAQDEKYISEKCAVFVADGVRYTLRGRTSFENMKYIVDTMKYESNYLANENGVE